MNVSELVMKLSQTMDASDAKEVFVNATNSSGEEVSLRITGVLEFKNSPGKVFIRAEPVGL